MLITFQTKIIVSLLAESYNLMIVGAYLRRDCTIHVDEIPGPCQG